MVFDFASLNIYYRLDDSLSLKKFGISDISLATIASQGELIVYFRDIVAKAVHFLEN